MLFRWLCVGLICVGLLSSQVVLATSGMSMFQIYRTASEGNLKALRTLRSLKRGQIDTTDAYGNTALCTSVSANDYPAFNLLKQAGASPSHTCFRRMSPASIQSFNQKYAAWVKSISLAKTQTADTVPVIPETGLSTEMKVAIGVGAVAVVGGAIALAASGGGGSSGSDNDSSDDEPKPEPDACANINCGVYGVCSAGTCHCYAGYTGSRCEVPPSGPTGDETDPNTWRTAEFKKGNFLDQIKAEYAYARGYTGYVTQETVDESGNTLEKVRVGVLDYGTDINHPDLIANIAKDENGNSYGYNFDYGPCRNGDKTNCYSWKERSGSTSRVTVIFYDENSKEIELGWTYRDSWDNYAANYTSDYDWDKLQTDPTSHEISEEDTSVDITNTSSADHGTHVAGIVGATKNNNGMHGVAPNVEMVVGIVDPKGIGFEKAMETYARENVRVINMSFGYSTSTSESSQVQYATGKDASEIFNEWRVNGYKTAANNNIVIVKSAGNDGNDLPASVDNGIPLTTTFGKGSEYDMTNLFISVVAASPENKLASYSQTCGAAQGYCLTAPGGDIDYYLESARKKVDSGEWTAAYANQWAMENGGIYATVQSDNQHELDGTGAAYGYMQGTSMAAPVVTGSVALLMGAYPHLTSQEVVEILFRTADKESLVGWTNDGTWTDSKGNTYATSSVFGHGMVDLDKATQPLGDLTLASENSVNGAKVSVKATRLALPRLINASVAERLPVVVAGLDDYNRAFPVVTSAVIRRAGRSSESFKRSFRSFMHQNKVQTSGLKDKMSFSFSSSLTDDNLLGMGTLDMHYAFSDKSSIRFSYRSDTIAEEASFNQVLMNPFVDMTDAYSLTHRFDLNKKVSLSFGAALGKNGFFEGDEDAGEEFNRSMSAFQTEMAWRPFSKMTLKAVGGVISEKDAALGLNGTGAFETGSTHTVFYGAVAEYNPLSTLTLSAAYYYGRSMVPRTNSLVSLNWVVSDSFALDVRYRMEKRMAGIQLSSPLRIRRGTASFDLPVGRDAYTDTIYRERFDVSLKPRAREYNFGVYYTQEDDSFEWRYELGTRIHPDHMDGVKPDYRALFGLVWRY